MSSENPILTISVAAKLLKLHPRTLMLYEKSGLTSPFRTGTKRCLFSIKDLERLQFVKYLTRIEDVNLRGVRIILEAIQLAEKEGVKLKKSLFPSYKPKSLL